MKFRVFLIFIVLLFFIPYSYTQSAEVTAKAGSEILHLIRKEKLDLILPKAMSDNNVDM